MKLKTAFVLSIIVNVVFLTAVGYVLVTDLTPGPTQPLHVYGTNAPASVTVNMAVTQ